MSSSDAVLGKRKRKPTKKVEDGDATAAAAPEDAQAIFRRYFEAQFAPLEAKPVTGTGTKTRSKNALDFEDEEDGDGVEDMRSDSESEGAEGSWDGLSGEDESEGRQHPPRALSTASSSKLIKWTSRWQRQ